MLLNRNRAQKYLQKFDFESLFIEELGWDTVDRVSLPFEVDGEPFEVAAIAQKRGFIVYQCTTSKIPVRPVRVKLDRQLTDYSKSHLLVFGDEAKQSQTWMWVRQELGKPLAPRFEQYQVGQSAERLLQKLETLAIAFEEEEKLTLVEVSQRVKKAFDVEKVTKKFFTRFEKEHGQFLKFIDGIQSEFDRTWYASLMLNRLMFVYFIQKKTFLDGDINYLRNRLKRCQAEWGTDTFHSFYRQFLLKLFHEGLGKPGRDSDLDKLLGKVPYLNGGLFEVHQLEEKYEDTIQIPDAAFEQVFNFFDEYDWHLDDRLLRNQNEINPDVLGYIFEKYINQKQMGAYYTKEDITEYISKNTIIPFLLDAAQKACGIAFEPDGEVWALLRETPDRYIYPAVRQGVDLDLPDEIAAGVEDVSLRGGWNKPATAGFALPTETWREHVARRQRCLDLRRKLAEGEVTQINDLVTYNLDIRQFVQDVITSCERPDLLEALYQSIEQVSVLDPTCGSGAFLFAALNILEPLYTACLERMQSFVDEDDPRVLSEENAEPNFETFRAILAEMAKHPNSRYFVLKSIMLNNLYGVDIMEEATEICKLRLFLKLVAQMEPQPKKNNFGLEPLPDIDFNIRAGNSLVGFASLDEVRKAIKQDGAQLKLDLQDDASRIDEKAELADRAFQQFRQMQTEFGMNAGEFRDSKKELRRRLAELNDELNHYLAREYGVEADKTAAFEKWRESHQPFHWFIEFYSIIDRGGFDVIIGNPPYLEKSKLSSYSVLYYETLACPDIYAWVVERALKIKGFKTRIGLIIPISIAVSGKFKSLREIILEGGLITWFSHFANRPGQLFEGAQNRLTILNLSSQKGDQVFSSRYYRWDAKGGERDSLFDTLNYSSIDTALRKIHGLISKSGSKQSVSILKKTVNAPPLNKTTIKISIYPIYWVRVPGYFCYFFLKPPMAKPENGGVDRVRGEVNSIYAVNEFQRRIIHSVLNSTSYYHFFSAYTDCRHINPADVKDFPLNIDSFSEEISQKLISLSKRLEESMLENTKYHRKSGLLIESVESEPVKPIIDEIDRVLAQHYGFTDEELDFIINYDIKYRMGRDSGEK